MTCLGILRWHRVCESLQDNLNAAYGWTSYDEHEFTASVTKAGGMVHASDFIYNLCVFSQLPPYRHTQLAAPAPAPAPAKATTAANQKAPTRAHAQRSVHTVAFVNSDGDNLQLLQNDWISTNHWNHPDRGMQASGWSYSPAMAVLMPSLLAYTARTASVNDSLSTGSCQCW